MERDIRRLSGSPLLGAEVICGMGVAAVVPLMGSGWSMSTGPAATPGRAAILGEGAGLVRLLIMGPLLCTDEAGDEGLLGPAVALRPSMMSCEVI
jgi:hypothetical protein